MLHLRMIYDEILKNSVFASSRPGRTDARVILILALLLKYKRLRREMILFLIQHIDPCIQEAGSMGQRTVKTCIERGWIKNAGTRRSAGERTVFHYPGWEEAPLRIDKRIFPWRSKYGFGPGCICYRQDKYGIIPA